MSAASSIEVWVLGWSALLLIAQVVAQAVALDLAGDLRPKYLLGPRDEGRVTKGVLANRLLRASRNLLETYPAYIALVAALAFTGKTGGIAAIGAVVWIAARLVYVLLYAAGIPIARTVAWFAALAGLGLMAVRLVG